MSSFRKFITVFFLVFLTYISLIPAPTYADIDIAGVTKLLGPLVDEGPWAATKEFCDKRSGDLMNLETWFSGKCGKDVKSSIRGEGVGFADIVVLQGMESVMSLFGPTYKTLPEQLVDIFTGFSKLQVNIQSHSLKELASNPELLKSSSTNLVSQAEKSLLFLLTNKPASSVDYVNYIASNLKKNHIVDSAYAANSGYGFTALSPILPLWRAFRNIAYLLFAFVFVLYGIMIMFRIKIDSKTAATIQLAIPKLIATLLMITFSYAIVGLLIDISTVAMSLSIDVLRVGGIITGFDNWAVNLASGQSFLGLIGSFVINGITSLITTPLVLFNIILGGLAGSVVGGAVVGVVAVAAVVPGIASLAWLIIVAFLLALLFSYAKIFFAVVKSYITVIIYLIFAPIMLLGNVMPGSKAFSSWITNIVANLAVFPVITFFLTLSYALMMQPMAALLDKSGSFFGIINLAKDSATGNFWTPPMTSLMGDVGLGTDVNYGSMMLALVGIMLLFMCSKYADMVMDALKVPPFKYGSAMGDALKSGWKGSGNFYNQPISNPKVSGIYEAVSDATGLPKGKAFKP